MPKTLSGANRRAELLSIRSALAELERCAHLLRLSRQGFEAAMKHRANALRVARARRSSGAQASHPGNVSAIRLIQDRRLSASARSPNG